MTTTFSYNWGAQNRTVTATDPYGNSSYTLYNAMDLPEHVGGTGVSATAYGYDDFGRRTSITTYRDGTHDESTWPTSGDTTTWVLDPGTGLPADKEFADYATTNKSVKLDYTPLGRVAKRTWERGVYAQYTYHDGTNGTPSSDVSYRTGELYKITYSDATPTRTYTYHRSGTIAGVTDATGTRSFAYLDSRPYELNTETLGAFYGNRVLTRSYDSSDRANGFELGNSSTVAADLSQIGTFDGATDLLGHLDSAAKGGAAQTFTYTYNPDSSLVSNYQAGSFTASYDYDASSAARVTRVEGTWGGASVTRYDLGYDAAGRVQWAKQSGSAYSDYYTGTSYSSVYNYFFYDAQGQLKTAVMYRGAPPSSGAPASADELPGRRFEYRYDGAGNRLTVGETGSASTGDDEYTPNALNQYGTVTNKTERLLGIAGVGATVSATSTGTTGGSITVNQTDRSFGADAVPDNLAAPAQGEFSVTATLGGNSDTSTRGWVIPEASQALHYDDDGNLTDDKDANLVGTWKYTYDAENRLIEMDSLLPPSKGFTRLKLQFTYDYLGRRVEKIVTDLDGVLPTTDRRYLYDGWNLVAELDGTGATVERSYTWGLDVTGTGASAGVGALLQVTDNTVGKTYYPTYDGNGNVASLVRSDGTLAVTYEYSAFGRLLRSDINSALSSAEQQALATEPFRYSTKFTDTETGLVYYGLRYYSPTLGRFINRDPAEESGGVNLYAFCRNNPVGRWDVLGMTGESQPVRFLNNGYDAGFVEGGTLDAFIVTANRWQSPSLALTPGINLVPLPAPFHLGENPSGPKSSGAGNPNSQAPNKTENSDCAKLAAEAAKLTREMNETLSDANVVEGNIRLGDAVSTAHLVLSDGIKVGVVAARSFRFLSSIFTVGGYLVRGAGTLGVGGTVLRGVPGTVAGDTVNASIAGEQGWMLWNSLAKKAASTAIGAGVFKAAGELSDEFTDALSSGQGALGDAYKAAGALESGYYNYAAKLKAVRSEFAKRGCKPGAY